MGPGTGHTTLGDKFKVENGLFAQFPSYNSGPMTAIYLNTSETTAQTAVIKAEGGSTCKTFTFKDLGISAYSASDDPVSFSTLDIVLKDKNNAQIGATISLGHPGRLPPIA